MTFEELLPHAATFSTATLSALPAQLFHPMMAEALTASEADAILQVVKRATGANLKTLRTDWQAYLKAHDMAPGSGANQGHIAAELAQELVSSWLYDATRRAWMHLRHGVWAVADEHTLLATITAKVDHVLQGDYNWNAVAGIAKLLEIRLSRTIAANVPGWVPFANGALDLATRTLHPHEEAPPFTWQIPHAYTEGAECPTIQGWFAEAVGHSTECDRQGWIDVLRAYLKAILTRRTDLQRYLELIGPGGSGKGTYIRLAQAMIGQQNTAATELKHLESSRFETAQFVGKTLMIITDAERYAGDVSMLKAITGEDAVRTERKYKDPSSTPLECLVLLAANEPVQSADYTSGLERRRISVPMVHRPAPDNVRDLLSWRDGRWHGAFAAELPELITWVLALPDDRMEALIRHTTREVPTLSTAWIDAIIDTNPLADWAHRSLIFCPQEPTSTERISTNVGYAQPIREGGTLSYYNEGAWLYPHYRKWADHHGNKSLSSRRFTTLLDDLLTEQLHLNVVHTKDRDGSRFIGIRLRRSTDADELLLHTIFPASVKDVNSSVNPQTRIDEECDASEGFLESSLKGDTLYNEKYHSVFHNKSFSENPENPSHSSPRPQNPSHDPSHPSLTPVRGALDTECGVDCARADPMASPGCVGTWQCYVCPSRAFWVNAGGEKKCRTCHPPVNTNGVRT